MPTYYQYEGLQYFGDQFFGGNLYESLLLTLANASITNLTPTRIDSHNLYSNAWTTVWHGSGFSSSTGAHGDPNAGVIDSLELFYNDGSGPILLAGLEGLDISAAALWDAMQLSASTGDYSQLETIFFSENFTLDASAADERVYGFGGTGNDNLIGGQSIDFFFAGPGNDHFDGGPIGPNPDIDAYNMLMFSTFNWESGDQGIEVNFATGQATDSYGGQDTFENMRQARGTAHGDTFIAGSDPIWGYLFYGGNGADYFQGDVDGWEAVNYAVDPGPYQITFDWRDGTATDTFGIEEWHSNIDRAMGTDWLGGSGDFFYGNDETNDAVGFGGDDHFDLGGGSDTVSYHRDAPDLGILGGVVVDLVDGTAIDPSGDTDTLINVENIRGTYTNDVIRGDEEDNWFRGHGGNDTLEGRGGNDILDGGAGIDTAVFSGNFSDYSAWYTYDGHTIVTHENGGIDGVNDLVGIERATFADGTIDPFSYTADMVFEAHGGKYPYLAQLALAAYHLAPDHETVGAGVNNPASEAADDAWRNATSTISDGQVIEGIRWLTVDDLPGLAMEQVGGEFGNKGLVGDGVYINQNAAALVGRASDALFISFRGTSDFDGIEQFNTPDEQHWFDPIAHFSLLRELFTEIHQYITAQQISEVYVTGHSLGAAMAQSYLDDELYESIVGIARDENIQLQGLGIANPGVGLDVDEDSDRIVNFVYEQDSIRIANYLSASVGDIYYLDNYDETDISNPSHHDILLYVKTIEALYNLNLIDDEYLDERRDNGDRELFDVDIVARNNDYNMDFNTVTPLSIENAGVLESAIHVISDTGNFIGNEVFNVDTLAVIFGNPVSMTYSVFDALSGYVEISTGDVFIEGYNTLSGLYNWVFGGNVSNSLRVAPGTPDGIQPAAFVTTGASTGELDPQRFYDGGALEDTISFEYGVGDLYLNLQEGFVSGAGFEPAIVRNFENVIGGSGNDALIGDDVSNALEGAGGNDTLVGGLGADHLDGGDGIDTASYAGSDAGVTVNLGTGTGIGGHAQGDTLADIENLIGSAHADNLAGDGFANSIAGGAGGDTIDGGSGSDTLDGGSGNDRIVYDASDNAANVTGGTDTDTLVVIGGSVPFSYDLAAGSFELAAWLQTDTGANAWDTRTTHYGQSWQQVSQDTQNDDGSSQNVLFDWNGSQSWSSFVRNYNASSQETERAISHDDGTSIVTLFDLADAQDWTQFTRNYNASSQETDRALYNDDGTSIVTLFDLADAQDWTQFIRNYNASSQETDRAIYHDDGTSTVTLFDVANAQSWDQWIRQYDDEGNLVDQVYV